MASSFVTMRTLEVGSEVTADDYNDVVTNLNKIFNQKAGEGTLIKNLDDLASLGLPAADYDSTVFSVAASSTTDKAHSLSAVPSLVIVEVADSATPAVGDYRVAVHSEHSGGADGVEVGFNNTNVRISASAGSVLQSDILGNLDPAYIRVQAWK